LPGAALLLDGAVGMAGETGASRTLIIEEIDNALAGLRKDPAN
jgi:hypothetical protein